MVRKGKRANRAFKRRERAGTARAGRIALLWTAGVFLVLLSLLIAHPISYVPLVSAVLMVALSYAYLQVLKRSVGVSVSQISVFK